MLASLTATADGPEAQSSSTEPRVSGWGPVDQILECVAADRAQLLPVEPR
jgi:hypothetical protein